MKSKFSIFKQKYLLLALGIIALYFFTRLYNILSLPIFTDEAIYVRWAQIAGTDAAQRFISLTDGKQPSFVWLAAAFMKIVSDPLLASRLVSVLAGFGTLIGLFLLGQEIFKNRKIGLIVALVYVLYPFSLVYDRLAIYDSLVAMFIVWALFFEILLVRHRRLDLALILGMIMGGGMLTKTSVNFSLILLPFSLLLFDFKQKNWRRELGRFAVLAFVSVSVAYGIYSILRLSPYFYIIAQKNVTFVYPLREWLSHPFTFLIGNLKGLGGWLVDYVTIPFLILALSSFLVGKKYLREKALLLIWFIAPFAALALFGKVIYPRFILFMTMPLIILGSYALYAMITLSKRNYIKVLIVTTFLGTFLLNDFFILTDFSKARIPQSDKAQLLASWPSGVGVNETVEFLRNESKDKLIYVGTEGTFGLMPYALEIYLKDNKNIEIQGFWPVKDNPPDEVIEKARAMPTYLVFYQPCPSCPSAGLAPAAWPLEEVFKIKKVENDSYYTLYKVVPQ